LATQSSIPRALATKRSSTHGSGLTLFQKTIPAGLLEIPDANGMRSILCVSHQASLTGAPLLLSGLARSFSENGYRVSVIAGEDGPLVAKFREAGEVHVDPLYPDETKYWREIRRAPGRIALLRRLNPDIVLCNTIHSVKWAAYARGLNFPTVMYVHELSRAFAALGPVERRAVKSFPQHFIAVSDAVKQYLVDAQGIAPGSLRVIYAGIDAGKFGGEADAARVRSRLGLGSGLVVGTVGRITHVKGSDLFLEFAGHLKRLMGNGSVKFLVIGTTADTGCLDEFKRTLRGRGLQHDVVLVEDVPDASEYYSAMDVYVSTAREDPFPLVVLEAMASGKPVIGFAVGGIPEAVTAECGILISGLDPAALAASASMLLRDPALRQRLGQGGRKRVESRFALERYTREMRSAIEEFIH
jgi:glycosyltransferase involved in cell wall biosynthesis